MDCCLRRIVESVALMPNTRKRKYFHIYERWLERISSAQFENPSITSHYIINKNLPSYSSLFSGKSTHMWKMLFIYGIFERRFCWKSWQWKKVIFAANLQAPKTSKSRVKADPWELVLIKNYMHCVHDTGKLVFLW